MRERTTSISRAAALGLTCRERVERVGEVGRPEPASRADEFRARSPYFRVLVPPEAGRAWT